MYTKGKWKLYSGLNVLSEKGRFIASCGMNGAEQEKVARECEANARLISAAPELLEALKNLVSELTMPIRDHIMIRTRITQAEQAIAKATQGEI